MRDLAKIRSSFPRSGIRTIMDYSSKIPNAIHLEVGEPNVDTPLNIREAAKKAINEGYTHYTPNAGLLSLRKGIMSHLKNCYGLDSTNDQIVVTPGAVTALATALLAVVDIGEEVLIPDPGWPNYEQMILSQGAIPVRYQLDRKNGFRPDFKEIESKITSKTKAIIINTPGNPTGTVLSEKEIKAILNIVIKHDIYLISDEVYDGIVFEGKHTCPLKFDKHGHVISVFGFSKNYAMTGWRVGYAVAPEKVASVMAKLLEPLVSCASSVSQKAAEAAITGSQDFVKEMCAVYKDRRDKATKLFMESNVKVYKPNGAFYMLVDLSDVRLKEDEDIALTLLQKEKVAVAPGDTFGASIRNMVRISFATEESLLLEGVKRICHFVCTYR